MTKAIGTAIRAAPVDNNRRHVNRPPEEVEGEEREEEDVFEDARDGFEEEDFEQDDTINRVRNVRENESERGDDESDDGNVTHGDNDSDDDESSESDEEEEEEDLEQDEDTFLDSTRQRATTSSSGIAGNILQFFTALSEAAREYYNLSQNDQLQVWNDLTGWEGERAYSATYENDPFTIETTLEQLSLELQRMPASCPHQALDLVLEKTPGYLHDRRFMLKFLRAEKMDVFAAATRLCRYLQIKMELFGPDKLGRDIVLDDLDEDDMAALKSGYVQILQEEDHGHRPILFYYKAVSSECYKKRENILRSFFYMASRLSEDEEVQRVGVSNVVYNNGGFPRQGMDYEKSRQFAYLFRSIPVRFNTFYVCLDDQPWLTVVETFAVMITRFLRVRLRMVRGTHEQVVERLRVVGVPVGALPVNSQSELLVETHWEWIKAEKAREETERTKQNKRRVQKELQTASRVATTGLYTNYESQMDSLAQMSDIIAGVYGSGPGFQTIHGPGFQTIG